ncbi:MAG: hypothetical protein MUE55_01570, partial [Thermoplasmata archaeon]|nr:hypothetical protein [Thermoplasmata archaeon]
GPAITVIDSAISMFDSDIPALPEYSSDGRPAGNLTLTGSSTLLAVNSHISVDFGPVLGYTSWFVHNVLVLDDLSKAYLYGTSFDEYVGNLADRSSAIEASGAMASPALPSVKGAADNTGENLAYLESLDSITYEVSPQTTMEIETWDVGTILDSMPVSSASILVTYSVASNYVGTNAVQWAEDGGVYSTTGIVPASDDLPNTEAIFEIPLASVPTVGDVRTLDLRFVNNGAAGTGSVEFDRAWILFSIGGSAYIYRWLNTTIGDEYGVPIPGATITATFTGATEFEGQDALYYVPGGVTSTPPSEVLDYLGETADSYATTKSDGRAVIPFLTDLVLNTSASEVLFVGAYEVTGSATIDSLLYSSSETFSFSAYPAMTTGDQSADFTVELVGVVAESPDLARWLVVTSGELV